DRARQRERDADREDREADPDPHHLEAEPTWIGVDERREVAHESGHPPREAHDPGGNHDASTRGHPPDGNSGTRGFTCYSGPVASASIAPSLLVAMPQLLDPNFHRTVVLLVHHDVGGSFGVVLNRITEIRAERLCESIDIAW